MSFKPSSLRCILSLLKYRCPDKYVLTILSFQATWGFSLGLRAAVASNMSATALDLSLCSSRLGMPSTITFFARSHKNLVFQ